MPATAEASSANRDPVPFETTEPHERGTLARAAADRRATAPGEDAAPTARRHASRGGRSASLTRSELESESARSTQRRPAQPPDAGARPKDSSISAAGRAEPSTEAVRPAVARTAARSETASIEPPAGEQRPDPEAAGGEQSAEPLAERDSGRVVARTPATGQAPSASPRPPGSERAAPPAPPEAPATRRGATASRPQAGSDDSAPGTLQGTSIGDAPASVRRTGPETSGIAEPPPAPPRRLMRLRPAPSDTAYEPGARSVRHEHPRPTGPEAPPGGEAEADHRSVQSQLLSARALGNGAFLPAAAGAEPSTGPAPAVGRPAVATRDTRTPARPPQETRADRRTPQPSHHARRAARPARPPAASIYAPPPSTRTDRPAPRAPSPARPPAPSPRTNPRPRPAIPPSLPAHSRAPSSPANRRARQRECLPLTQRPRATLPSNRTAQRRRSSRRRGARRLRRPRAPERRRALLRWRSLRPATPIRRSQATRRLPMPRARSTARPSGRAG